MPGPRSARGWSVVVRGVVCADRYGPGGEQVRIRADPALEKWDVEIAAPPTFSRVHRLAPLFGLIFRRSSCQHPLLAGALGAASSGSVTHPCPPRAHQLPRWHGSPRLSFGEHLPGLPDTMDLPVRITDASVALLQLTLSMMTAGRRINGRGLFECGMQSSGGGLCMSIRSDGRQAGCGAGKIAEEPAACSAIAREVGAIQQLILMALSENEVVVQQACKTIGEAGRSETVCDSPPACCLLQAARLVHRNHRAQGTAFWNSLSFI